VYILLNLSSRLQIIYFIVFVDDDEIVPKNASVIVRRVPAKNANLSLIGRLKRRESQPHGSHAKFK